MADKKKLKMGQFAYDLKTNKAVFKIGTETYDVFPIDTELSETSNNPVSNAVITGKIKEIEEGGGSGYVLPPATAEKLGGIKVGEGLTIASDGTLSANGGETPTTITIDKALDKTSENAIANKPVAEKFEQIDKAIENITPYELPKASTETLGGIKVGQNLTIDENGVLNAEARGASSATDVTYDDTITQIGVSNVQAAIEYLKAHGGGGTSADFYTYDETMEILNEKSGGDEPDMICGIFSDVEEAYIIEESILGIFKEETENE